MTIRIITTWPLGADQQTQVYDCVCRVAPEVTRIMFELGEAMEVDFGDLPWVPAHAQLLELVLGFFTPDAHESEHMEVCR